MARVAITEQYLEDIADAIRSKTGMSTATYFPSEMADAIMTISGGGGITPTGTISITENGTYNVTNYASASVNVPTGSTINNQNKTVSSAETDQTVTADTGYTGLGTVTVTGIGTSYVGSGITRRSSTDLTTSGATITAPAGYYSSAATKSVSSGTEGTPVATKGIVSNNSVSITPSVTNVAGYISGGTHTGTAVSVSASELVSGNKEITANGTGIDVANYSTVSVSVSGGTEVVSVVDTTDTAGGTIRTITAVDISDTTATAADVASGKYFYTANGIKTAGTGSSGIDLSWLAASTPTPSVRNFFAALVNGNCEHGEFTLSSQPSDTFVDLFTMTNFSATIPPQGILFIDKDFYQGITGLSQNANEYCAFTWLDKAFINPASDTDLTIPKYATLRVMANQSGTSIGNMAGTNFTIFDGTTQAMRAFWQFDGNKCQCKFYYNNQNQYTPFLRGRTYIWIVY